MCKSSTSQCLKFLLETSRSSHPEAWDPQMESFTAEFVVQRTALAESSSSSHSKARDAFFGFSHLFAELGVPGQRGKSICQACGAQNWTKFAIHQVSERAFPSRQSSRTLYPLEWRDHDNRVCAPAHSPSEDPLLGGVKEKNGGPPRRRNSNL